MQEEGEQKSDRWGRPILPPKVLSPIVLIVKRVSAKGAELTIVNRGEGVEYHPSRAKSRSRCTVVCLEAPLAQVADPSVWWFVLQVGLPTYMNFTIFAREIAS
eukprot:SAG11_NODE_8400_length_1020_cov_1.621064_2_plen_103_part_00